LTHGSGARLHRGEVVAPHARQRAGRGILLPLLLLLDRLTPPPSRGAGTLGLRLRRREQRRSALAFVHFSDASILGRPRACRRSARPRQGGRSGAGRKTHARAGQSRTCTASPSSTARKHLSQRRGQRNFEACTLGSSSALSSSRTLASSRPRSARSSSICFSMASVRLISARNWVRSSARRRRLMSSGTAEKAD